MYDHKISVISSKEEEEILMLPKISRISYTIIPCGFHSPMNVCLKVFFHFLSWKILNGKYRESICWFILKLTFSNLSYHIGFQLLTIKSKRPNFLLMTNLSYISKWWNFSPCSTQHYSLWFSAIIFCSTLPSVFSNMICWFILIFMVVGKYLKCTEK